MGFENRPAPFVVSICQLIGNTGPYAKASLVCPTDGLELKINSLCTTENYFYASLGNTFHADLKTIEALGTLINNKGITQVNMVLSTTNTLVLEALKGHYPKGIQGLSAFYETMTAQAQHARRCGPDDPDHHVLLSYYIHSKINTLQPLLQYASNTKLSGVVIFMIMITIA